MQLSRYLPLLILTYSTEHFNSILPCELCCNHLSIPFYSPFIIKISGHQMNDFQKHDYNSQPSYSFQFLLVP